jgi:hypothetical protein
VHPESAIPVVFGVVLPNPIEVMGKELLHGVRSWYRHGWLCFCDRLLAQGKFGLYGLHGHDIQESNSNHQHNICEWCL